MSSVKLPEQTCKPRPVVVSETEGNRPYHILVYRCSGTCDENVPPSQKPCTAAGKEEIAVDVTGPWGRNPKTIYIYNHTSCSCDCNIECNWAEGERPHPDECKCLPPTGPSSGEFGGEQKPGVTTLIVCPLSFWCLACSRSPVLCQTLFSHLNGWKMYCVD